MKACNSRCGFWAKLRNVLSSRSVGGPMATVMTIWRGRLITANKSMARRTNWGRRILQPDVVLPGIHLPSFVGLISIGNILRGAKHNLVTARECGPNSIPHPPVLFGLVLEKQKGLADPPGELEQLVCFVGVVTQDDGMGGQSFFNGQELTPFVFRTMVTVMDENIHRIFDRAEGLHRISQQNP